MLIKQSDACKYGNLTMWAERGLVHIIDDRDDRYEVVSVRTTLRRMQALQDMLRNSRAKMHSNGVMDFHRFDEIQRMLEEMLEVARKAQVQGMPSDESARRDLARRRPCTVVMPSAGAVF